MVLNVHRNQKRGKGLWRWREMFMHSFGSEQAAKHIPLEHGV